MLKAEVEGRGMRWVEDMDGSWEGKPVVNGTSGPTVEPGEEAVNGNAVANSPAGASAAVNQQSGQSGRLTDEQLRLLLADRLGQPNGGNNNDEDEGLHL